MLKYFRLLYLPFTSTKEYFTGLQKKNNKISTCIYNYYALVLFHETLFLI